MGASCSVALNSIGHRKGSLGAAMVVRERVVIARGNIRGNDIDRKCAYNKKKERKAGNISSMFPKDPSAERQRASTSSAVVIADHAHANDGAHAPVDHALLSTNPATAEGPFHPRQQVDASESLEAGELWNVPSTILRKKDPLIR